MAEGEAWLWWWWWRLLLLLLPPWPGEPEAAGALLDVLEQYIPG